MSTITVEALASFGSGFIAGEACRTNVLLLCGSALAGSLERFRFEFLDGQELRPGARGPVRMTFAADVLPPLSGPLVVWAGRIVGHIWGLHTVYRSHPEAVRVGTGTDASGSRNRPALQRDTDLAQIPSVLRPVGQPAM